MKKLFSFIMTITIILILSTPSNSQAAEIYTQPEVSSTVVYLENGDYIETTIEVTANSLTNTASTLSSSTKTGTKTTTYKNASNEALWSVSVTGTFTYTGQSCTCTSASGQSKSYSSVWKVSTATASKSGNTATAKATGTKYFLGIAMHSYELAVTLTCSNSGVLS